MKKRANKKVSDKGSPTAKARASKTAPTAKAGASKAVKPTRVAKPTKAAKPAAKATPTKKGGLKRAATSVPQPKAPAARATPSSTVHPAHFEDLSGQQFERLVFAYFVRTRQWRRINWYGQVGSDSGRDILGITNEELPRTVIIQVANRIKLTFAKVRDDLAAAVEKEGTPPHEFIVVCGHAVSASLKDRIRHYAGKVGVPHADTWSGTEFEEYVRRDAEPLLRRFLNGVVFPDAPDELTRFANNANNEPTPSPQTISTGAGSTVAGRDVTNLHFNGPVHFFDEGEGEVEEEVAEGYSLARSETAVLTGGWSLSSVLFARAPEGHRSPHFWRVAVFSDALRLTEVTHSFENAFRDLVRCTFPENAAAELGDASSTSILVEHMQTGVSRVWGRWDRVVGMAVALDESLSGSYRAQVVAALITRFLSMVATIADRGPATVSLELNPANRTLAAEGAVENIRRPSRGQADDMARNEVLDLRDLRHVPVEVAVRLLEPLLRDFHNVRFDRTRFTHEVVGFLNAQHAGAVAGEPRAAAAPSIDTINRLDAIKTIESLSPIDLAYLRVAVEETLAGRVLAATAGATDCAGPLLSPRMGLVTAAAVHQRLRQQFEGLDLHRVQESERKLRAEDFISAESAPSANYEAAGRPSRPGRVSVFSRATRKGLRSVVACSRAATEVAYALMEASVDLDEALDGLVSIYHGIVDRFSRRVGQESGMASYAGAMYARIDVVDDGAAHDIDLIRGTRDSVVQGRPAPGLSPGLVRTAQTITALLRERHPRLTLISYPADDYGRPPGRPALVLAIANFGQESADGVVATFEVSGGFGLGRADAGGGWHQAPSLQSPRIGPLRASAYDHVVVAELRRFSGSPVQGKTIRWSLTGGGARPVAGELHFEPSALEPS